MHLINVQKHNIEKVRELLQDREYSLYYVPTEYSQFSINGDIPRSVLKSVVPYTVESGTQWDWAHVVIDDIPDDYINMYQLNACVGEGQTLCVRDITIGSYKRMDQFRATGPNIDVIGTWQEIEQALDLERLLKKNTDWTLY